MAQKVGATSVASSRREYESAFTRGIAPLAAAMTFVLLAAVPAFAQDVKYNYAMGTNFAKDKTYKWVDIPNQNHPNQLADQQIRTAIEAALGTKGFTKATGDVADMLIAYQIAVDRERQWNAYGGMGGLRFGGMGTASSSTINIGTLVFDVFDAAQAAGLDRRCHEDDEPERRSAKESEDSGERCQQIVEELSTAGEVSVWPPETREALTP